MAVKQTWTFEYAASDVLDGARRQLAYHERKIAYWLDREHEREDEARQAITMGQGVTTVEGRSTMFAQPQYDQTKMQALAEAQQHRKDHQAKADGYRTWVNVLTVQFPSRSLALDFDDVVFFGLADHQPLDGE